MKLKEKRMMSYFIDSTREIIDKYGFDEISIRKIAEHSGYNSATLYNYFKNLDVLLIYSSISYFKDYIIDLRSKIKNITNPIDRYIEIYKVFNEYAFKYPDIYFNMFYGKYSKLLPEIIDDYYNIFPEELKKNDVDDMEDITKMFRKGDIYKRDYEITKEFIKFGISSEDTYFIIDTTIRVHSSYLYQVIYNKNLNLDEHKKNFIDFLNYLIKRIGKYE